MHPGGWKVRIAAGALMLAGVACPRCEPDSKREPAAPQAEAKPAPVDANAEKLERGRYLVEAVLACGACHSERDTTQYGGPIKGAPLAGACQGPEWGFPGRVCAPNITSDAEHGVGRWTDEELLRALREGKGRNGRTLFPSMPYLVWRSLSDDDARAVVAYLRQVPAVAHATPRTELPEAVYADIRELAQPLEGPVPGPAASERGAYLATIGQCALCHGGMGPDAQPFEGGVPVPTPYGPETVPGLLPHGDVLRGLGEDAFVARFTAWKDVAPAPSREGQVNKLVMPWGFFARMHEEDLRAVFQHLQSVPAPSGAAVLPGE